VPDHLRRDRGLVDKDEARRTQLGLLSFQRGALGSDVTLILLGCVQCFFEGDVVTVEETPDRTDAGLLLSLRARTHADLLEGQVWIRGNQLDQPLLVLLQRRAAVPRAELDLNVSGLPPAIHPSDRRRSAEVENARGLACAFAGLDKLNRTHPEILGSLCHRMPLHVAAGDTESDLRVQGNPSFARPSGLS
jgi:hypothetical protein